METFVRVVEAGSFSAAGKQLGLSVAAVSRHIGALEEELGSSLVARTTRRMTVTPVGRLYYERCLRVLGEVDEAQAVGRQGVDGPLRMSIPVSLAIIAGHPLVKSLLASHPTMRLDLRVEDRIVDLALENVDVAIRVGAEPPLSSELVATPLTTWRRVVVASPGYIRRNGEPKTPTEIPKHEVLSAGGAASDVWTLTDGTTTTRIRFQPRLCSNASHLVREAAIDGRGVALLPDWFVAEDIRSKRLRRVLRPWSTEVTRKYALYRASLRGDRRVRAVVDHLRGIFANFTGEAPA